MRSIGHYYREPEEHDYAGGAVAQTMANQSIRFCEFRSFNSLSKNFTVDVFNQKKQIGIN